MVIAYVGGKPAGPQGDDIKALLAWLAAHRQEAELRTEDGELLGRFVPEPICPWEPDLTEEEIERRIKEPGGMTLDEFWRKMGVR
jgi:hypothetical protein